MFSWIVTCPLTTSILLPSSSTLSIISLHLWYVQIKIIYKFV
ncbi:hypothetical protein E2C01_075311 [Portunus trituberculatus]|uniref:Uncharacterized protein n=1 Tax=Portunus trituberculatus TaxID=210409 RepID=A0A5B7IEN4_PORTR|nr:hypothetical protein [Portunus trituberculatus]